MSYIYITRLNKYIYINPPSNIAARIMKATCVTLSIISLAGLSLTYTSTILIIAPPSLFTCLTGNIMMNIGISLTFGCLFLVSSTWILFEYFLILLSLVNSFLLIIKINMIFKKPAFLINK